MGGAHNRANSTVCNAALQAEINAAQTNRAAISAAQRQRGM
jgi:hypothetical protein